MNVCCNLASVPHLLQPCEPQQGQPVSSSRLNWAYAVGIKMERERVTSKQATVHFQKEILSASGLPTIIVISPKLKWLAQQIQ